MHTIGNNVTLLEPGITKLYKTACCSIHFYFSPSAQSPSTSTSPNYSLPPPAPPDFTASPCSSTVIDQVTHQLQQLAPLASVDETRQWLTDNRFTPYASLFVNYGGKQIHNF